MSTRPRSVCGTRALRAIVAYADATKPTSYGLAAASPAARWLSEVHAQPFAVAECEFTPFAQCIKATSRTSLTAVIRPGERDVHRLITEPAGLCAAAANACLQARCWWLVRSPTMQIELRIGLAALRTLPAEVVRCLAPIVTAVQVTENSLMAVRPKLPFTEGPVRGDLGRPPVMKPRKSRPAGKSTATALPPIGLRGEAAEQVQMSRVEVALKALAEFSRLEALQLDGFRADTLDVRHLSPFKHLTRLAVTQLQSVVHLDEMGLLLPELEELDFSSLRLLDSLEPLVNCTKLRTLDISQTSVASLSPLTSLPALEKLACSGLCHPTQQTSATSYGGRVPRSKQEAARMVPLRFPVDLGELGGAPRLRHIHATRCHLTSVAGLSACPRLEKVTLSGCRNPFSLDGLASATSRCPLTLDLFDTVITSLVPLRTCQNLVELNVGECARLESLGGLEGLPNLRLLNASACAVATLCLLSSCPALEEVDLSCCRSLVDVSGLGGAPALRSLKLNCTPVSVLGSFRACEALDFVNVGYCPHLTSLEAFAGAPCLRELRATQTSVTRLGNLAQCPALEYLDVRDTPTLVTLEGLEGAPQLRLLDMATTSVSSLQPLRALPALEQLNASGCQFLTSVEPLRGALRLESISLRDTSVTNLTPLRTCPVLGEVYTTPPPYGGPQRRTEGGAARTRKCTAF